MTLMAERFSGNIPYPKKGAYGSNRRGLLARPAGPTQLESQRSQSNLDKQKQIEKFRRYHEQPPSPERVTLDLGNKELPAYKKKHQFQQSVRENKVTISTGETGSGKSTQGPQYLIEAGIRHTFVLVPRQVVADNLGDRIRYELQEHFGDDANGMIDIVHGDRSERKPGSVATVMTPETFIRMYPDIESKYADEEIVVFNDEIHEANLHTELGLSVAAIAVKKHPKWRMVLASATMNEAFIQDAYKELNEGNVVPIVKIEGRPHSIETNERPDVNAMQAYLEVGDSHNKTMIFVAGEKEIKHVQSTTASMLESREEGSSQNVVFRKLISTLTMRERRSVLSDPVPEGSRLVVVSTPIGMSGITFEGCTLVIADGIVNRPKLDKYGIEGLVPKPATKAEITQMWGRSGRDVEGGMGLLVRPTTVVEDSLRARGVVIEEPQFEFMSYGDREEYPPPDIYNTNLSRSALEVAGMNLRFTDLNPYLPHKVELSDILRAEHNLLHLGAVDAHEDAISITKMGIAMDRFPIIPELSRGLVEASGPERTIVHMARAALIAIAVDAGGLQDFSNKDSAEWKSLVRRTSNDDFMAQLDLMTALQGRTDLEAFAHEYDLNASKVEKVTKTTHKVFKILNINLDNIILGKPKPDEENVLRNDFTPGLVDLVYEKSFKRRKVQLYQHILGNEGSTQREISDRSAAAESEHDYIAGFPRWYFSKTRQGDQLHEIIDRTLIVQSEVIVEHVSKIPSMLTVKPLASRFDGGRVIEQEQRMFGSIQVGGPVLKTEGAIPEVSRELLKNKVLAGSGKAQEALREIAKELQWYKNTIPSEELRGLIKADAPADITHESIESLIYEKTSQTRDAYVIDDLLADHISSKNVAIQQYFDEEVLEVLRTRSPSVVSIGKSLVNVYYENGQPYITKIGATQKQAPLSNFYLPDGREILVQISRSQRLGGTVRVSPKDLLP